MADNNPKEAQINTTSLSLGRESIENAFSKKITCPEDAPEVKIIPDLQNCDKCEYKTIKVKRMRDHILVKHSVVKEKCTKCDYQHHFQSKVRTHFKQVHMGIPKKRPEDNCKNTQCPNFGTKGCKLLEDHILLHCSQCKFTTTRKDQLKHHVVKLHEGPSFTCEFCQKSFVELREWKRHTKEELSCDQCKYTGSLKNLKHHIKSVHDKITYPCNECNLNFKKTSTLNCHIKEVHQEVLLECSQCKFTGRSENLKYHIQIVHDKITYPCDQCNLDFTKKPTLKRHIREVHEEILPKCSQCNYTGRTNNLKYHIQSVHAKITYPCDQCNSSLKTKSILERHKNNFHKGM